MAEPSVNEMLADFAVDFESKLKTNNLKQKEDELSLVIDYSSKIEASYNERFEKQVMCNTKGDPEAVDCARSIKAFCDAQAKKTASLEHARQTLPKEIKAIKLELGIPDKEEPPERRTHFRRPQWGSTGFRRSGPEPTTGTDDDDLIEMEKDIVCMEECVRECKIAFLEHGEPNITSLDALLDELEGVQDALMESISSDYPEHSDKGKTLFKASQNVWRQVWDLAKLMNEAAFRLLKESEAQDPCIGRTSLR
ncbi:expressed unknown protein [Seminavis robusta]|uniref:Uncharacterized protein n=1 Tax=Seminavis robusta TaxID=568900 RepID=A0A9N8E858_9STRA|nr:expressed unknown protein [Seminavis robusta]|eukprot:Sro725_g193360.1 n/a (252) ;mRNA; f:40209-41236